MELLNCKRIGILGGTFNPVHIGHLFMAEHARTEMNLDMIMFIPTGVPYMKNNREILPSHIRMEMLEMSITSNPFFVTSDMEIKREGNTYTYETLEELKRLYPEAELFFLVGADCLFTIHKWYQPQRIFNKCTLLAANRNDFPQNELNLQKQHLEKQFHAKVELLNIPQMDISSTKVRENIKEGKSIRYLVTDSVHDYILQNNYYQEEM
ncbi:MAG: nicotinate-nucleotide adenylyltransferase [Lachnospiraceae bacterium]|nr:nicotinate-nucleotide adenylyltransferase [Lachnospiraceae bacterium]